MPYPKKYKNLLEIRLRDVEVPDYVFLTYTVCACDHNSCGWGGWMIEAGFKKDAAQHNTATGDRSLSVNSEQRCPKCGRETFRTMASVLFEPSEDQSLAREGSEEIAMLDYDD